MFIVGGIGGSVVFGIWVEKTLQYKAAIIVICFLSGTFNLCQFFLFRKGIVWLAVALCFMTGFASVSMMAVAFDFAVELTYPIGESFSTGVLMSGGQIFGIIYSLVASKWLADAKSNSDAHPD